MARFNRQLRRSSFVKTHILPRENGEQSVEAAKAALLETSKLEETHTLAKLILHYYEMLLRGCSLSALITEADKIKHSSMDAVV